MALAVATVIDVRSSLARSVRVPNVGAGLAVRATFVPCQRAASYAVFMPSGSARTSPTDPRSVLTDARVCSFGPRVKDSRVPR